MSKVISRLLRFRIAMLCDWLKSLRALPQPIRSKTKTNRVLFARVFPRLAPAILLRVLIGSLNCLHLLLFYLFCLYFIAFITFADFFLFQNNKTFKFLVILIETRCISRHTPVTTYLYIHLRASSNTVCSTVKL